MKIALAQIKSLPGDIRTNTVGHLRLIDRAAENAADAICFPELSLTAYEPDIAKKLAFEDNDIRLESFSEKSISQQLWIGIGIPYQMNSGIAIGMRIFEPSGIQRTYTKKYLHQDELAFFTSAENRETLTIKGQAVSLAICYELSVDEHQQKSIKKNTLCLIASVAKHEKGVSEAYPRMSAIARKYQIPTLLVNAIGMADGMMCAGRSAVWDSEGNLREQLPDDQEGLLIYDLNKQTADCLF